MMKIYDVTGLKILKPKKNLNQSTHACIKNYFEWQLLKDHSLSLMDKNSDFNHNQVLFTSILSNISKKAN